MQSKEINIKLAPSKVPLLALPAVFFCAYVINHYIPHLKYITFSLFVLVCLFWLYRYLNFKAYSIIINTINSEVLLDNTPTKIIRFRHITWWLSIIYLKALGKTKKIYLFADSIPFKSYKTFKIYSQWI